MRPADGDLSLRGEGETIRLGEAIGRALERGEALCLDGPLGAGKSVLARAALRRLSPGEPDMPSPTFTLVQAYDRGAVPVTHIDLYRLASPGDLDELGLEEALTDGVAIIEWAERLGGHPPPNRLDVRLSIPPGDDTGERSATLTPHGAWVGRSIDV
ncbi:MAG: tRNA (adenosine(37)-N6)-threonylcarbamoyltransferase complex ATPase subunit type 1 TsaE [Caulobacteraceae bacterium]|nr:tRNA (adenosine(37)-N6)-threonylcarbamoyltransferase complex ATPase subunit type 1 TsaE [Caulobacteraceae bacterium]